MPRWRLLLSAVVEEDNEEEVVETCFGLLSMLNRRGNLPKNLEVGVLVSELDDEGE